MNGSRRAWSRWAARLLWVVASLSIPLAAGELAARWKLGYAVTSWPLRVSVPPPEFPVGYGRYTWNRLRVPKPEAGQVTFDPREVFGEDTEFPPNLFRKSFRFSPQWSSNSYGFRGREFSVRKPAGVYRIVCLGGSTTEGIGVGDDETYPAQLERLLKARAGGRPVEVINAGLSGFGSYDLFYVMRSLVLPLDPDLVIYYEVGNRIGINEFYLMEARTPRPAVQWVADRVALYRALRQIAGVPPTFRQAYTFTEHQLTDSLKDYLKWLDRIVDLAESHGIAVVLAEPVHGYRAGLWTNVRVPADVEWQWERWQPILPEHVAKWYEATAFHMRALAVRRGLPWIPLRACLPFDREYFLYHNPTMYDPVHYSARGNGRIAGCIADAIAGRVRGAP